MSGKGKCNDVSSSMAKPHRKGSKSKKGKKKAPSSSVPLPMQVLPPLPETGHSDVARLREHLAFVRESYQESLKELQEFQALSCADRLELEALRKLVQEQQPSGATYPTAIRTGIKPAVVTVTQLQYDSDDETEIGNEDTVTAAEEAKDNSTSSSTSDDDPQQLWLLELQILAKNKADCEMRLVHQSNQLRDMKYLLKELQADHVALQRQLAAVETEEAKKSTNQTAFEIAAAAKTSTVDTSVVEELQEEIHKWEALYFETAEMGSRSIQKLEEQLDKILKDNQRLEYEKNDALLRTDRKRQEVEEKKQDYPSRSLSAMEEKSFRWSLDRQMSEDVDEIVWMERLHQLQQVIAEKEDVLREYQRELACVQEEKNQQAIELQTLLREKAMQEQRVIKEHPPPLDATSVVAATQKEMANINSFFQMDSATHAMVDIFCCGQGASVVPLDSNTSGAFTPVAPKQ